MACIRAMEWGSRDYWEARITAYMEGTLDPRFALKPRVLLVACEADAVVGMVAGHLTKRHGCQGELEWINVVPGLRGTGVASKLIRLLAAWFAERDALRVCVDVKPDNLVARRFYTRHGAEPLNPHWLVWTDIRAALA